MSIPCGLLPTGFVIKPLADILSEVEDAQHATIATDLDVSPESVVGMLNGIFAQKLREGWEMAGAVANARDPRNAAFAALDGMSALTATKRKLPTFGTVTLRNTLSAGVTLPAGSIAQVQNQPTNRWVTAASITNATGSPADVLVAAVALAPGKVPAFAGTITAFGTPVSGWTAVTNDDDAQPGTDLESDPALRARRAQELEPAGTGPVDAIRTALLAMTDIVASAVVQENASSYPDALGRPPHSVEGVVQFVGTLSDPSPALDAARQRVANAMWASKGGGIDTFGAHSAPITTASGDTETMRWSEPVAVPIYVTVTLDVDSAAFVGIPAVKRAVADFGASITQGRPVVLAKLEGALVNLAGVNDVLGLVIGTDATTQRAANVLLGPRAFASFDTAHVTVVIP